MHFEKSDAHRGSPHLAERGDRFCFPCTSFFHLLAATAGPASDLIGGLPTLSSQGCHLWTHPLTRPSIQPFKDPVLLPGMYPSYRTQSWKQDSSNNNETFMFLQQLEIASKIAITIHGTVVAPMLLRN
jgi:hypothetical protein